MAPSTLQIVQQTIADSLRAVGYPSGGLLLVAVSGGQDSSCLLHALSRVVLRLGGRVAAAHVNHRLRGAESDADEAAAGALAEAVGVPFVVRAVDVEQYARTHRLGLEEAARSARYQALLAEAARTGAWALATGHTANDLAETLLINILRGTGLAGLGSIQPLQQLDPSLLGPPIPEYSESVGQASAGSQRVVRPLLSVGREVTARYCREAGIQARLDVTNLDPRFLRNRIRHHLLPLLRTYNPSIVDALVRTARIAADEDAQLEALTEHTWPKVVQVMSDQEMAVTWEHWSTCSPALQRRLLRRARRLLSGRLGGSFEALEAARQLLAERSAGRRADLGHGVWLVTDRHGFRLVKQLTGDVAESERG